MRGAASTREELKRRIEAAAEKPWLCDRCGGERESEAGTPHICPSPPPALNVFEEAYELVSGPRAEHYGPPVENLRRIGTVWAVLLDLPEPVPPRTVAVMMAALKLVREGGPKAKRDNLVDACGYLLIAEQSGGKATGNG